MHQRVGCYKSCTKMTQNGSKVGFFEVTEKFGYYFFLDLLYNESLYYLLFTSTNRTSGKNVDPEMWG